MNISREQFQTRYDAGKLGIAFIGMSNIGKSYTAMRLATRFDFSLVEIDKLIWEQLGQNDMDAFAKWQGKPYSDGYAEREAYSISLETQATRKAMDQLLRNPLLDTTGSVIYTDADVLKTLTEKYYVVHIEAAPDDIERLKSLYFNHPKPLIWTSHYHRKSGLSEDESIIACYPDLLEARKAAYKALADISIPSSFVMDTKIDIAEIFDRLKPRL